MNDLIHNVALIVGPMLQIVGGITVLVIVALIVNDKMTKR